MTMSSVLYRPMRAAALAASLAMAVGCDHERMTLHQVERVLAEKLPNGSSPERVSALLDSLGLEHSGYDVQRRDIAAVIKNTSRSFVVDGSIHAEFVFDEDRKLVDRKVREVLTGP